MSESACVEVRGELAGSQSSLATLWVPGINLSLPGLAVSTFAHCTILPTPDLQMFEVPFD